MNRRSFAVNSAAVFAVVCLKSRASALNALQPQVVGQAPSGTGAIAALTSQQEDLNIHHHVTRLSGDQIAVTMETRISAPLAEVYDFVCAADVLPKILTGHGFLPGVISTSGQSGPWNSPGSYRTVHLKGGGTAREEVITYQHPRYFAYKLSDFSFSLKHLATGAKGEWWFEADADQTKLRWTYTFQSKSKLSCAPLSLLARTQWEGYMKVCLNNVERHFVGLPPMKTT